MEQEKQYWNSKTKYLGNVKGEEITKTMEISDKVKQCNHDFLKYIGIQENPYGADLLLGNCVNCGTTKGITDNYKLISELKGDKFPAYFRKK